MRRTVDDTLLDTLLTVLERCELYLRKAVRIPEAPLVPVQVLERLAIKYKAGGWECNGLPCAGCDTEQRNVCYTWIVAQKKKEELIAQIPYTKEKLMTMTRKQLVIIAGHLKVNPFKFTGKETLVDAILRAQSRIRK